MPDEKKCTKALYLEHISPKMKEILALCTEHGINVVTDFEVTDEEGVELSCSSNHAVENGNPSFRHKRILDISRG